jgi:lipoyl(octanoyl) transferase
MAKQPIIFRDLGTMDYQAAWDYQEMLLKENVLVKTNAALRKQDEKPPEKEEEDILAVAGTTHYLLFTEHPPVYTLGKSGNIGNMLMSASEMEERNIRFFNTNRGGDITFHGPGQVVGYPIFDLEKFGTDIGKYLRNLEEVIILTLQEYGIIGDRSAGETGVWIEPGVPGRERKICAIGVRCSRWITMHGFAFNVNTDLSYFNNIIPCGITNKQVTSLEKECGHITDTAEVKEKLKRNFEKVFDAALQPEAAGVI